MRSATTRQGNNSNPIMATRSTMRIRTFYTLCMSSLFFSIFGIRSCRIPCKVQVEISTFLIITYCTRSLVLIIVNYKNAIFK